MKTPYRKLLVVVLVLVLASLACNLPAGTSQVPEIVPTTETAATEAPVASEPLLGLVKNPMNGDQEADSDLLNPPAPPLDVVPDVQGDTQDEPAWQAHIKITDSTGTIPYFDDVIYGRTEFHQTDFGPGMCEGLLVTSDQPLLGDLDFTGVVNGKDVIFAEPFALPANQLNAIDIDHQTNCSFAVMEAPSVDEVWQAHIVLMDAATQAVLFDDVIYGRTEFHQTDFGDVLCKPLILKTDKALKGDLDLTGVVNGVSWDFAESFYLPVGQNNLDVDHSTNCSFAIQNPISAFLTNQLQ